MTGQTDRVAICGWCPTELPDTGNWIDDAPEVQHHFFAVHNQRTDHSIRYVYPDHADSELARLVAVEASRG